MTALKLIYFDGCPNAEKVRGLLRKIGVRFQEVRQDDLPPSDRYRGYTSPTILDGEKIVVGSDTEGSSGGCSLDIPSETELKERLHLDAAAKLAGKRGTVLSMMGAIFSSLTVGFCPVCIPAIGAFLSAIGLGFLVQEAVLKPVLVVFLGMALFGFFWSYLKEHGRLSPLILGSLLAAGLYVSRYVYLGATINTVLMYGSIAGLVGTSYWNIRLKKKAQCRACDAKERA